MTMCKISSCMYLGLIVSCWLHLAAVLNADCPKGFYGRDCINRCNCSDGGPCRFNGSCLTSTRRACKPGWTGSACNIRVCPVGFYGRDCINRCHCSNGGPCRFNGSCLTSTPISCKPGWIGSACNVRDCSINNGDCEYNEKCETVDLGFAHVPMCRCEDGSYRDKNNNSCSSTHLRHVGCYKGSTTQYTSVELPTNNTLTIELCILKCRQLNKKYSIIQGGATCRCGDEYARNSPAPDAECQVPCVGNKQQYCGGMDPVYVIYTAKSFLRHYIGCYKDTSSRAMEKGFQWLTSNNNTIDSCIRLCASLGYSYAGLQFSFECFCGNSYEKYGSLPESRCNMNCSGNRNQICGGSYANSVYGVNDILGCSTDRDCKRNESCKAIDLLNTTVSRCRCEKGFHEMPTEDFCKDVDECESGELLCNPTYENCVNMIGSYRCECKAGFINMSGQCEDIDECKSNTSSCNPTSENCVNNIGSYRCECKNGFRNMSGQCEDIDECQVESPASPCNAFAEYCLNSIGSYICMCKEDFTCGKCDDKHVRTKDQQTIDQENRSSSTTGILLGTFLAISLLINAVLAYLMNCARSRRADSGRGVVMSDIQRKYWKVSAHHENYYDDTSRLLGEDDVYEEIRMKRQVVY